MKPHSGGVAGAMMSLDEVAKRMWAIRNDPRLRGWALRVLAAAGNPTGASDKMQAIMEAFRKKVPYVSDPVQTEFIASPIQLLCLDDHGLCIPGADCDEFTVGIGGAGLSIGIPVQVVGASYKAPVDQPVHVYGRFMGDSGEWIPFDGTTTYSVGNVHETARTWIVDPNKGVGAAGLPGGDFVGVGRHDFIPGTPGATLGPRGINEWGLPIPEPHEGIGVGQSAAYATLLQQVVSQDLPALEAAWAAVQTSIASDSSRDPCSGLGGPTSVIPALQQISDEACTVAHEAALAAFGYMLDSGGCGIAAYEAAQNAADQACTLEYYWGGAEEGPYGTVFFTGSTQATCLSSAFLNAVGSQVQAAVYAVRQAQVVANTCIIVASPIPGRPVPGAPVVAKPVVRRGPTTPNEFGVGIGLGLTTPSDVLAYRVTWNSYVIDTVGVADSCSKNFTTMASTEPDASTKAWLVAYAATLQSQADSLLSEWNLYANSADSFIVLEGAGILQSFQETVLAAGTVRSNITSGPLPCVLTYVNSAGQLVQAAPGANPSAQAQVIAHIEGLGILASGTLQILVGTTSNSLVAVGSATQWAAKQTDKLTTALATPGPWIALTAVAGAVIVYELWK